jgi:ADP-ribose pyrophosphatase YjhB (NUDIX family)
VSRLSASQKEKLASFVRWRPVRSLMALAVRIVVTRHMTGVTLVCFNSQDEVLLMRHVFHPRTSWDLPGGWLERDESPAECILRELREETGLTAELGPVVLLTREKKPSHVGITYMARLNGAEMEPELSSEILEARWFAPHRLPDRILPSTRQAVKSAVRQLPMWPMLEYQSNV